MLFFLIGMPGVGKTYWGRQIAAAYNCHFVDLDEYIVKQEGQTIKSIFESKGEAAFRLIEQQCLSGLIVDAQSDAIVACGGGTPCFHENLSLMKEAGKVIYLESGLDYLLRNLNNELETRPLLKETPNIRERLELLLSQRQQNYLQADYILQTENISLTTFDEIIQSCINRL